MIAPPAAPDDQVPETGAVGEVVPGEAILFIARRAYGFHSWRALAAMHFLCCGGITLSPPVP